MSATENKKLKKAKKQKNPVDELGEVVNTGWQDLTNVRMALLAQLHASAIFLKEMSKEVEVEQTEEYGFLLSKLQEYTGSINTLHDVHKDKGKLAGDPDEVFQVISIGNEYQQIADDYQLNFLPVINALADKFTLNAIPTTMINEEPKAKMIGESDYGVR